MLLTLKDKYSFYEVITIASKQKKDIPFSEKNNVKKHFKDFLMNDAI